MLVTFFEDIDEDDGYSKLGLGIGLFSDDYGPQKETTYACSTKRG